MPEKPRAALTTANDIDSEQDGAVLGVLTATAPYVEEAFFRSLTLALTTYGGVRAAVVSELLLDVEKARCLSACLDGKAIDLGEYSLAGTPCNEVVGGGLVSYNHAVANTFPDFPWLAAVHAELCVAIALRSESGDILGTLSIVDDMPRNDLSSLITLVDGVAPRVAAELERYQRWEALRRSETRMRLLVESSKDVLAYFRLQPSRGVEYISPSVVALTGYREEAFHVDPSLPFKVVHEDDVAMAEAYTMSGSEDPIALRIRRPDGSVAWVEVRQFPLFDEEHQLSAVVSQTRDITARIEAQEALRLSEQYRRALLDTMPDTLLRLSADGVILDFVPGEEVRDVLPSGKGLIGQNIRALLPAAFSNSTRRLTQAALRTGQLQRVEFEVAAGHDSRFYEARCMPFSDEEVLLILRDFTAMKWHEGETERRRYRDELDQKVEQRIKTNPYGLTYRELTILHLVAEGSADKQIAETLGISIYTVNKHVGNILSKMNAASRTEAGVRGIREGLLG
ncbi:MAG: PAS domain S-box protein [Dehalococcoidia bacterium]|nr:PAS domain S-box protein [Dehalococcoidia bacterium]